MRILGPALLVSLLAVPGRAGETWAEHLRSWLEADHGRRPWTLRVDSATLGAGWWRREDAIVRLLEDQDLAIDDLEPAQARGLAEARGWGSGSGSGWILLGRSGEIAGEGRGLPGGEEIRAAVASGGYRSGWERREAFLAAHPGQGEALEARLFTALGLMRARFLVLAAQGRATAPRAPAPPPAAPPRPRPGPPDKAGAAPPKPARPAPPPAPVALADPAQPATLAGPAAAQGAIADAIYQETADTLEQLIQLPDWWRMPRLMAFCTALETWDAHASPRMRGLCAGMRTAVLEEWQRNPHYGGDDSARLWIQLERCVEGDGTPVLPPLDPSPGRIIPGREAIARMIDALKAKGDWRGILAFLARQHFRLPEGTTSPFRWREYSDREACIRQFQALAYGKLGLWKDAGLALAETRHWAGYGWPALAQALRRELPQELPGPAAEFAATLVLDPEPYPAIPPPFPPVRMLLAGGRPWSRAWAELWEQPALAPWDPSELIWKEATVQEEAFLAGAGLTGPRWAALQGESTLLATGTSLPDPGILAAHLGNVGPTRLERLNAFIERNPDPLDARRDRFLLLRQRMPNPALEPLLAADAARAWIDPVLEQGRPWRPDPEQWGFRSERLVRELDLALRRWPSDARLWKLWLAWIALLPERPSVHGFALGLTVPEPLGRWQATLPLEAHTAIARELRARGRFEDMRTWFQSTWDTLREDPLRDGGVDKVDAVCRFLGEALAALGLREALAELKEERGRMRYEKPADQSRG
jgi:hypothetical protein